MSRESMQFLEMVREAYQGDTTGTTGTAKEPSTNGAQQMGDTTGTAGRSGMNAEPCAPTRVMWCEGCGGETVHRLEGRGDWDYFGCEVCQVYGHWYRVR